MAVCGWLAGLTGQATASYGSESEGWSLLLSRWTPRQRQNMHAQWTSRRKV